MLNISFTKAGVKSRGASGAYEIPSLHTRPKPLFRQSTYYHTSAYLSGHSDWTNEFLHSREYLCSQIPQEISISSISVWSKSFCTLYTSICQSERFGTEYFQTYQAMSHYQIWPVVFLTLSVRREYMPLLLPVTIGFPSVTNLSGYLLRDSVCADAPSFRHINLLP